MSSAVVEENNVITKEQINEVNSKFAELKRRYEALGKLTDNQKKILEMMNNLRVKFCDNKQRHYEYINGDGESIKVDIYEEFNRKYQNNMDNLPTKDQIDEVSEKWNYIKDNYFLFRNYVSNGYINMMERYYRLLCLNKDLCEHYFDDQMQPAKRNLHDAFNGIYADFTSKYDAQFCFILKKHYFIIGPNCDISDNGSKYVVVGNVVDQDTDDEDNNKSYLEYMKDNDACLLVLNPDYRLTNEMLQGLRRLVICDMSILSNVTEIPKDLKITILIKHDDKLSNYPILKDYLVKCYCNNAAMKSYFKQYKLNVIVFCDEDRIDEFQKNNQYDIGYNFVDVDDYRNIGYGGKHNGEIDELVKSYKDKLSHLLSNVDSASSIISDISFDLYQITSNKFLNEQIVNYYKEVMDVCVSIVNQKLYNSTAIVKKIDLNALLKDFVSIEKISEISDYINKLIYALDKHMLDKLYKEKLKNLFRFNNISTIDIVHDIDLLMNTISLNLYKVTSNKCSSEQIINYYKEVMDLCISIVEKLFYSTSRNIVIKDIDLNALLKDFLSVETIGNIQDGINGLKNKLNRILIIDVEGDVSLPVSCRKHVYVINPKTILTNKRIYVDSYFDYNTSVFSDKAHDAYRKITEPTKSCCSKLFISSYDNIKNSVCDWVYIDYDNTHLIKIIESRQSRVVDIAYQKDEFDKCKCEIFIDICKQLKTVRGLPFVFAPTGLKHQSISIKNQMHWKIFAVCPFAVLLVIGFYYFNVNWSVLNAVVAFYIIVILLLVSMFIVYLIGRFDVSHDYFYKVIYHIMSPFAEWDFNTFMVVCRDNNGLSIVAIAIIFVILFIILFYFTYDSLLKFVESFHSKEALNDSVNNNLVHEQVHSVDTSSVSIIDENNLEKSNESVVDSIVTKDADILSEFNVNEQIKKDGNNVIGTSSASIINENNLDKSNAGEFVGKSIVNKDINDVINTLSTLVDANHLGTSDLDGGQIVSKDSDILSESNVNDNIVGKDGQNSNSSIEDKSIIDANNFGKSNTKESVSETDMLPSV